MGTAAGPVILAEALVKHFGAQVALRGLDLQVLPGEVFGFIGPNGAGKTTTIRLLLDLVRPTSGRLEVFGTAPRAGGPALRRRIGYLPGDLRLHDRGTVRELVDTFVGLRYPDATESRAAHRRVAGLAERLDLDPSRQVRALSKGNRQKVGIVLALMPGAELLVLDEPTSGLDPLVQQDFLALVREQRDAGRTVFMSSHVLSEVEEVADRVGIIAGGVLVDVDDLAGLRSRAARLVQIRFAEPLDPVELGELGQLPGVTGVSVDGPLLRCSVSTGVDGGMDRLVKAAARHRVVDVVSHVPDLEELFLTHYARDGRPGSGPADPTAAGAAEEVRRGR